VRATLIASLAWAAACGSDSGGTSGPSVPTTPVGSYTVSTVNGKALPAALYNETNYLLEVTTGTLVLTTDGKYSSVLTTRQTIPMNVSTFVDSVGGTWVLSGTDVNLTNSQDGSTGKAVWAGNQLTIPVVDGKVTTTYVYGRK
jgi:hypothetical protein